MNRLFGLLITKAFIAWTLVALFAMPCAAQGTQKSDGTSGEKKLTIQEKNVAAGYSVIGPLELRKVSGTQLVIAEPPGKEPLVVDLRNKTISVMDKEENPLTMSAMNAGSTVIICQKKDSVRIYIVPALKKEKPDAM